MGIIRGIIEWIKGLFGASKPDPIEHVSDAREKLEQEDTLEDDSLILEDVLKMLGDDTESGHQMPVEVKIKIADLIERRAEAYENDQRIFMQEVVEEHDGGAVIDAIDNYVPWDDVFRGYSDETVDLIYRRGTNLQMTMGHARMMRSLASAERTIRSSGSVPEGHGMGEDGRQK